MTRLIDADKLYPDCLTKEGTLAISQSQIANAPTVEAYPLTHTGTNIAYDIGGHIYGVMGGDKIMAEFEKDMRGEEDGK